MKVVVVINSLTRGGAERVVSTLTREWAKTSSGIDRTLRRFKSGVRLWGRGRRLGCAFAPESREETP